ncbi:hypothetical protein QUF80_10590 [Desulfococcaceae bacterium HSG8]|nr:hypothetical protein [Desulfococcaceae bacterium HSG8]
MSRTLRQLVRHSRYEERQSSGRKHASLIRMSVCEMNTVAYISGSRTMSGV